MNKETNFIGYSNGVPYDILDIRHDKENIGLIRVFGFDAPVWCLFDRITQRSSINGK
jgi:hypothetical protein